MKLPSNNFVQCRTLWIFVVFIFELSHRYRVDPEICFHCTVRYIYLSRYRWWVNNPKYIYRQFDKIFDWFFHGEKAYLQLLIKVEKIVKSRLFKAVDLAGKTFLFIYIITNINNNSNNSWLNYSFGLGAISVLLTFASNCLPDDSCGLEGTCLIWRRSLCADYFWPC